MAKQKPAERPWYGKTCVRCEAPINYAYAKKGELPGYCGKCADEARRLILAEAAAAQGGGAAGGERSAGLPGDAAAAPRARVRAFVAGVALGLALAIAMLAVLVRTGRAEMLMKLLAGG